MSKIKEADLPSNSEILKDMGVPHTSFNGFMIKDDKGNSSNMWAFMYQYRKKIVEAINKSIEGTGEVVMTKEKSLEQQAKHNKDQEGGIAVIEEEVTETPAPPKRLPPAGAATTKKETKPKTEAKKTTKKKA